MAAAFDNTGDYLNPGLFQIPQSAGTLAFWWRPTFAYNDSVRHDTFHARNAGSTNYFQFIKNSNNNFYAGWYTSSTSYRVITSASGLTQNAWNHLLVTWDDAANETKLYLAGSQIGSTVTSLVTWDTSGANELYIGNIQTISNDARGRLAGMAIWSAVLSAGEITALYRGFVPRLIRPASLFRDFDLVRDFKELKAAASISNTGVTVEDEPPMIYPSHRKAA